MSDTTDTTTETPTAAPAAPVAPAPTEATAPAPASTQTASPGLSAPTPETSAAVSADPASAPEEPEETDPPTTGTSDEEESTTSGSSDDAEEEAPASPQVVNDDSGQHVVMPDGSIVHTRHDSLPRSNAEQATFELTHSGDQLRYPYKPGDKEYNAYSDPAIPNSHLARMVETEIVSFGERVLTDPKAAVSTMWNALKGVFDGELKQAIETGEGSGKIVEV